MGACAELTTEAEWRQAWNIFKELDPDLVENKFIEELGEGHELELESLRHFRNIHNQVQNYVNLYKEEI